MDNYYIPNISEFYIGFEYEERVENNQWEKGIIENIADFNLPYHNGHLCRVKYLDREDIESFGFKVSRENYPWHYELNHYRLTTPIVTKKDILPKESRITIMDKRDDHIYFDGVIKNKLELNKILKQIEVL